MRITRFAVLSALAAVAFVGVGVTTAANRTATPSSVVTNVGPFFASQTAFDSANGNAVGGNVRYYHAGADTLKIGQAVYLSADNTVRISTTASDHEKVVGIVVGGRSTNMYASVSSADVNTVAAVPNRPVIVLRSGRTWVMNDASGTINAGDRCKPSTTTAGKIVAATAAITATAAANTQGTTTIAYANADTIRSGGTTVTSSAANGAIIGHAAATITNGTLTTGAVTVAGDGFTKTFCTIVKGGALSTTVLAEINAH